MQHALWELQLLPPHALTNTQRLALRPEVHLEADVFTKEYFLLFLSSDGIVNLHVQGFFISVQSAIVHLLQPISCASFTNFFLALRIVNFLFYLYYYFCCQIKAFCNIVTKSLTKSSNRTRLRICIYRFVFPQVKSL